MITLGTLLAILAVPHIIYAFIWFFPEAFLALVPDRTVDKFSALAGFIKVVQFFCMFTWMFDTMPPGRSLPAIWDNPLVWLQEIHPIQFALFAALFAMGQALNVGIYRAIGHVGVYYGFKVHRRTFLQQNRSYLSPQHAFSPPIFSSNRRSTRPLRQLGHKVPWVTGFPFNVCPHPQYVGSSMTIWAFYALFCRHSAPALLSVALYWSGLYFVSSKVENIDTSRL